MTKLISNDITVSEQHDRRDQLVNMIDRWGDDICVSRNNKLNLKRLLKDSGIQCYYIRGRICGFELVDERAYLGFVLKYS